MEESDGIFIIHALSSKYSGRTREEICICEAIGSTSNKAYLGNIASWMSIRTLQHGVR